MKKNNPKSNFNLPSLNHKLPDVDFSGSDDWLTYMLPKGLEQEASTTSHINRKPLVAMAVALVVVFSGFTAQLINLQVVQGDDYRGIAEGNRIREQITYAPRGDILDRNGVVLATSRPSYQLSVTPYLLPESESDRKVAYSVLADKIDSTVAEISALVGDEGLMYPNQILVEEGIDHETALEIEYILPDLKGFTLDSIPVREYKSEAALSQVLGYVGRISEQDLEANPDLYPIDFIGKQGVEQQYDEILRGENGVVETEVDARGSPIRTLREVKAKPGDDLVLSIDYDLQLSLKQAVERQLEESGAETGAGIVQNPHNGEILATVSIPSYDNNKFSEGITPDQYQQLIADPKQPMFNRVVSGAYPTGSTIKPFNLMGALDSGTVTEDTVINDTGAITVTSQYDPSASFTFRGWDESGLGPVDARSALAVSSNIYFYITGGGYEGREGMGAEKLASYYKEFGLGSETGVDLPSETAGRIPTPTWRKEQTNQPWFVGDTYNLSIGQGDILVSPLQLNRAYGALANNGRLVRPSVLHGQTDNDESVLDFDSRYFGIIDEGLQRAVTINGTVAPQIFGGLPVVAAGKTGTAETDPGVREPHAWFSGYAPYDNPEIVATVILENGEGSARYAAPAVAEIFEAYFD